MGACWTIFNAWLAPDYTDPDEEPKIPTLEEAEQQFAVLLSKPRESLELYQLCDAMEWKHLPFPGGLLDQPEWFLSDVRLLASRMNYLRKLKKAGRDKQGNLTREGWLKRRKKRQSKYRR